MGGQGLGRLSLLAGTRQKDIEENQRLAHNEMLANYDNIEETIDEQSLIEGLSDYYFSHGESFDGLEINPKNLARFNEIKEWAIEYHRIG
jgi:hypothetical protein